MTGMLTAGLWIAAAVLVAAGILKLARPDGTSAALREARLPAQAPLVCALGVIEIVAGLLVLTLGGALPALATAALYLAFATFAWRQRRASATAGCGCLGDASAPVTWTHVVLDVALAVVATAAAAAGAPALVATLRSGGQLAEAGALASMTALALVALGTWLVRLALTELADLRAAVTELGGNA